MLAAPLAGTVGHAVPAGTVGDAVRAGAARLAAAGIDGPRREARLLLAHALGREPSGLLDARETVATDAFDALVARRAAREPMAHIIGRQGFWTLDLAVSTATLVPRADSEALIEAVRDHAGPGARAVLDLGTGSGALLLAALLVLHPQSWGVGVDRSTDALAVARRNARASGLDQRALLVAGDWSTALAGRFDVVLSNPPYIARHHIPMLEPEVAVHEPRAALDGGVDGLDCYRSIVPRLPSLLAPGGVAVLELGTGQADRVAALADGVGLDVRDLRHDLGGNARALVLAARVG